MQRLLTPSVVLLTSIFILGACSKAPERPPPPEDAPASMSGIIELPPVAGQGMQKLGGSSKPPRIIDAAGQQPTSQNALDYSAKPGEFIVRYADGKQPLRPLANTLNAQGVMLHAQQEGSDGAVLYQTTGLTAEETVLLAEELSDRPDIESVTPNWLLEAFKVPNDTLHDLQWNHSVLNLERAWDITTGSNAVTVAVLDSGSIPHDDLVFTGGYDFISDPEMDGEGNGWDPDPTDPGIESHYHGAHVAGIIGALTNNSEGIAGVTWDVQLVPVRVLGVEALGTWMDIESAIDWAAGRTDRLPPSVPSNPHPADIINLSLGLDEGLTCSEMLGGSDQYFVELTEETGAIVVVAAGNTDSDTAGVFPANCPGVITVGATGPDNEQAPYSNHGAEVDVMAPGGNMEKTLDPYDYPYGVLSTVLDTDGRGAYTFMEGTSMAAPHISGIIALLLSHEPDLTFTEILTRLQESSSTEVCEHGCGSGLVDALAALEATGETPPPPPPPPADDADLYIGLWECDSLECPAPSHGQAPDSSEVFSNFDAASSSYPYTLEDLEPGRYRVASWLDLNGDGIPDSNEPYGEFGNPVTLESGERTEGVDLHLDAPVE